jgi:hypothetical protein
MVLARRVAVPAAHLAAGTAIGADREDAMGPGSVINQSVASRTEAEDADAARLQAARESFPRWQVIEVFGGYLAVPANAVILQCTTLDGLVGKLRAQATVTRVPLSETFPEIRTPWKAVLAELRDAIERGDMVPGEPCASLGVLAEMYGVNRKTARKAVHAAAAAGLVTLRPGKGYFVTREG